MSRVESYESRRWRRLSLAVIFSAAALMPAISSAQTSTRLPSRPAWTTSHVQGIPGLPPPYRIVPAYPKLRFQRSIFVTEMPGTGRLVVGELRGRIYSFPKDSTRETADLVIDLAAVLSRESTARDRRGRRRSVQLFDMTFHPDFANNRHVFVSYVHPGEQPRTRVSRFEMTRDNPPRILPESEQIVFVWRSGGHNGGCLRFGPDGFLYISTGDSSGPTPPDVQKTGQDISNVLGAILRIDVDHRSNGKRYAIPPDNPFVDVASARPEIWAYGFRNPWKAGFDPATGDLWLGDVGWESWEMVHRVVRGGNYGWSRMEGPTLLREEIPPGPTPIVPPVKAMPRSEAASVTGGVVYQGSKLAGLRGAFIYGDYVTGKMWAIESIDGAYVDRELADTDLRIIDFAEGSEGELYVLDHDYTGQVYEIVPNKTSNRNDVFPRRLSQTGVFASVKDLEPAVGVIPFSVNAEPWMDGASARRLLALPGDSTIEVGADGNRWRYPDGAVLAKTLLLPDGGDDPLRLETQILHFEDGTWRYYNYAWNDSQDDALLVDAAGYDRKLLLSGHDSPAGDEQQTWRVAGRTECRLCHNAARGVVLGFAPSQLSQELDYGGNRKNQLQALAEMGVFGRQAAEVPDRKARLTDPYDESADLTDRARSYLDVNCAGCHHRRAPSGVAVYLGRSLSIADTRMFNRPGIGAFGIADGRFIVPGDPFGSVIFYRLAKLGYGRMPQIGSREVDSKGVALLHDWIAALDPADGSADGPNPTPRISSDDAAAVETLVAATTSPADRERDRAIRQLLATTRGALALIYRMHAGELSPPVRHRAIELSKVSPLSDVRGLFETFIPESDRQVRLGNNIVPSDILSLKGDAERGKRVFHSDATRCATCHVVGKPEESLGPDLAGIRRTWTRPELLRHVLDPSVKIDPKYNSYLLVTAEGVIHTGVIIEKTDDVVVLKNANKEIVRIAPADIEQLKKLTKSLMPDLLLGNITAQEAADLISYLLSLE